MKKNVTKVEVMLIIQGIHVPAPSQQNTFIVLIGPIMPSDDKLQVFEESSQVSLSPLYL